ncbi:glutathione synthetase [Striga asiatica]|uniref:Glutathione synthetase n=1 Tax=Striga asiatica TaxID=4170 RepID=A0A5A7QHL3_STRAF|nr:glutathione synthetase [Striga asiatica]
MSCSLRLPTTKSLPRNLTNDSTRESESMALDFSANVWQQARASLSLLSREISCIKKPDSGAGGEYSTGTVETLVTGAHETVLIDRGYKRGRGSRVGRIRVRKGVPEEEHRIGAFRIQGKEVVVIQRRTTMCRHYLEEKYRGTQRSSHPTHLVLIGGRRSRTWSRPRTPSGAATRGDWSKGGDWVERRRSVAGDHEAGEGRELVGGFLPQFDW